MPALAITQPSAAPDKPAQPGDWESQFWNGLGPWISILGVATALFLIRLLAPPNLLDQDQERPASYVLDAIKNGHWICQKDLWDDITSKPPMWTWISAATTLAVGRITVFSLYLPGALAAFGSACLIFAFGKRFFGNRAALIAAFMLMLAPSGLKEFGLARTDGVFAFTVSICAFCGYRAWTSGSGWVGFWLAAAAATLTKGPLGLLLGGGGLLAIYWERRSNRLGTENTAPDLKKVRAKVHATPLSKWTIYHHVIGILLFVILCGGWFYLSYQEFGRAVVDKMIGKELIGNAITSRKTNIPGLLFWQQPLYYLARAAPWSLLAYLGFWRVWKFPSSLKAERTFERFLFCWFFVGLVIFSLSPHQRGDLLWPIIPAGTLIAGRELVRLWTSRAHFSLSGVFAGVAIFIAGYGFYYFVPRGHTKIIQQTVAIGTMADAFEKQGGSEFPLTHADDPMGLQVYLNTLRAPVSLERAAEVLRGPEPAFVAVNDPKTILAMRGASDPEWFDLFHTPPAIKYGAAIIGNRPRLESTTAAFCIGPLSIKLHGIQLLNATDSSLAFRIPPEGGDVVVLNQGKVNRKVELSILRDAGTNRESKSLVPGEIWRLTFGGIKKKS
jgi:4-amino-4-deoxy-L-arabinose transferase-like glycosyltransferase